ncbi:M48 family metallopeptidase [Euzebya tangerina]|uniref:M48 family metallopeptidase n=1 Tax=Euzebya tangerina TaxID=591198 RepID=UPI0013C31474|nr:M48 family metallopeptidase [Euzebya tangerina]
MVRHWAEVPLLWLCSLVTMAGAVTAGYFIWQDRSVPEWALGSTVGLLAPVVAAVAIRWLFWSQIINAVPVSPNQLPDLFGLYESLVERMGLGYRPRLFVVNGNGRVNGFAAKCRVRRGYVVLSSDLVDVGYELDEWDTVRFVLAHELAHIRCGHVALWRTAIRFLPGLVRLDRSLTRAQEYTADRTAAFFVPEGAAGLMLLFGGKRVHRHVDVGAYRESVAELGESIWLRLANALSDHPVGFRRMEPLLQVDERGWDVHGRMF